MFMKQLVWVLLLLNTETFSSYVRQDLKNKLSAELDAINNEIRYYRQENIKDKKLGGWCTIVGPCIGCVYLKAAPYLFDHRAHTDQGFHAIALPVIACCCLGPCILICATYQDCSLKNRVEQKKNEPMERAMVRD